MASKRKQLYTPFRDEIQEHFDCTFVIRQPGLKTVIRFLQPLNDEIMTVILGLIISLPNIFAEKLVPVEISCETKFDGEMCMLVGKHMTRMWVGSCALWIIGCFPWCKFFSRLSWGRASYIGEKLAGVNQMASYLTILRKAWRQILSDAMQWNFRLERRIASAGNTLVCF